jgi:hypothetical protein
VDYQVGDVTAAATYYIAEIYSGLSRALLESERPAGLDAAELAEYELALEDEAYPFEERAIEVHEKNMELMRTGLYNAWIDRSLGQLAGLMPARYAKGEISSGFMGSLQRYAYVAPPRELPAAAPADAEPPTTEPAPIPAPPEERPEHTTDNAGRTEAGEVSIANAR